ncbi:MAG: class I SAM-dependent methyltransferase [Kofleriaceae bacterium]|nr:class I SAM-dependent methyltransferase [Kofleriaceae bacterium]
MTAASRETRAHFDERAREYYERNYEQPRNRHAQNLYLRRVACLSMLPPIEGAILDHGCGPGAMTFPLLERGQRVVSMDLSREMLGQLVARAEATGLAAAPVMGSATALPFATGTFGAVVSTGVLEYVSDLPRALLEIHRVLVPGGIVLATMSLPRKLERWAARVASRIRGASETPQFIRDRRSFDSAVRTAGFEIESTRCVGFAPFPLDVIWPSSVRWLDEQFGQRLDESETARDQAKTYIVLARRNVSAVRTSGSLCDRSA